MSAKVATADRDLAKRLRQGDRAALARAITLVESKKREHRNEAQELLKSLLPATGKAVRVGITGVPGVGKSTTIDVLGTYLTGKGRRVAVLAVDPSSVRTGGSILGDKTRMPRLAADERAFIRPSPSAGTLGGVASRTRETMLLCEAAGYDVVLVETVGAGQSEVAVAEMTDTFLVLMLPGAGDELQGIKKGLLELADVVGVNKAEGENLARAKAAASSLKAALHILASSARVEEAPVLTYSAIKGEGIDRLWQAALDHRAMLEKSGRLAEKRRAQQVHWMWTLIEERFRDRLRTDPAVKSRLKNLEAAVAAGKLPPALAADEIADLLKL
ncbi:MAG TPA: methylmalonyl Co-A mutase-associated GTPase MeaB [Xanthobacteraceae bacterium]